MNSEPAAVRFTPLVGAEARSAAKDNAVRRFLVWAVLLCGCGSERLVHAPSVLQASPNPLTFAAVAPGSTVSAPLNITNSGRTQVQVVLSTAAPYAVETLALKLEAGELRTLDVMFAPTAGGPAPGELLLKVGDARTVVTLSGIALCPVTSVCSRPFYDAVKGCLEKPVADGEACADACLSNARCEGGQCKGQALRCDDGEGCTTDTCGAAGCIHLTCLPPTNPCQVAACEGSACVSHDAADGTACGQADCLSAHICLTGQCVAAVPPDGAACQTDCGPGLCAAGKCESPALGQAPVWSYVTAPAVTLSSKLAADAVGNLYWKETGYGVMSLSELVSMTRDGTLRYRIPLGTGGTVTDQPLFIDDAAGVLLTVKADGSVAGFRLADGAQLWSQDVIGGYFTKAELSPAKSSFCSSMVSQGNGAAVAEFLLYPPDTGGTLSPLGAAMVGFDVATGQRRWANRRPDFTAGFVADELGNIYQRTYAVSARIESRDRLGALRWQTAGDSWPQAAFGGRVYLEHGETLDAASGLQVAASPVAASEAQAFGTTDVKYLEGRWLVSPSVALFEVGQYGKLRALDPVTHQVKWSELLGVYEPLAEVVDVSALLDDGSVVMLDVTQRWGLIHVDAKGGRGDSCPLQLDRNVDWGPESMVLQAGRLFTSSTRSSSNAIHAFEAPKLTVAKHGWVVAQGSAGRGGKPR